MADTPSVSDVVGAVGPKRTVVPTPAKIKPGSATVVAYAMIEEQLDANLMDDSTWLTFWEERGVTRLSVMVWSYVNQDAFADDEEERFTLRRVQSAINAKNLTDYMIAILRAFGQDAFADGYTRVLSEQKARMVEVIENMDIDASTQMPKTEDVTEDTADPTKENAPARR